MLTPHDPLSERVQASFEKLSVASVQLNAVSDELGKLVARFEAELKKLNLGIEAWVQIDGSSDPIGEIWWADLVGYAKAGGKWGIALRSASGDYSAPQRDSSDTVLFSDAPRALRISAIDKIPELLEKLSGTAEATTKQISDKLSAVRELVGVVSGTATAPLRK